MKKFILSAVFMMAVWMGVNAMSFERAQAEALYLTDKMAYELNLNDQQYNDAYEINLDYFINVDSPSDLYGVYYNHRLGDLRCILHDWQFSLLMAADYFLRPVIWRAGGWYFPIYGYYTRGYFYYSRPSVWVSYYGGHSHAYYHSGFYAQRRPVWNGGLRGHDMHRPSPGVGGRTGGVRPNRPGGGRGYHFDVNGRHGDGMNSGGGRSNPGGHSNPGGGRNNPGGGSMNPGGNHNGGNGSHQTSTREGFKGSSSLSGEMRGNHRGNSFDGSSSRRSGSYSSPSVGSQRGSSGSNFGGSTRSGGGSFSGSSRSGVGSFGGGHSGGSRGGGFSGGHGGGSRGGSFGGGHGGGSRGGRR